MTYEVGDKDKSNTYNGMVDLLDDNVEAQRLHGSGSDMALDTSDLKDGVDAEDQPMKYKDILHNPGTGATYVSRFVFTTFTGADGREHSLWLMMSDKKLRH